MFWKELWKRITKIFLRSSTVSLPDLVLDTDDLFRRVIFTDPNYIMPDNRLTSLAFKPRRINGIKEGVSVDIARLTTPARSIVNHNKYRLYSVTANQVRQIGLDCEHNPIQGDDAHALIVGNFKGSTAKRLSQMAVRVPFP